MNVLKLTKQDVIALSNQEKRKGHITGFKEWGLWYEDVNLPAKYYRCELPDGSYIVVSTFKSNWSSSGEPKGAFNVARYSLVKKDEFYQPGNNEYSLISGIVEHLKHLCMEYNIEKRRGGLE